MTELEQMVVDAIRDGIRAAIKSNLEGYNNPLNKLASQVVEARAADIRQLLNEGLADAVGQQAFRDEVKTAFCHSVARVLMSEFKGEIEKQAHAMRQNPEFRARVVLAIEGIVKESLPVTTQ